MGAVSMLDAETQDGASRVDRFELTEIIRRLSEEPSAVASLTCLAEAIHFHVKHGVEIRDRRGVTRSTAGSAATHTGEAGRYVDLTLSGPQDIAGYVRIIGARPDESIAITDPRLAPFLDLAAMILQHLPLDSDCQTDTSDSEQLAIQDVTPYGAVLFDGSGEQLWANAAASETVGCSLAPPLGVREDTLVDIRDAYGSPLTVADLPVKVTLRTGAPVSGMVVQMQSPDGHYRWLQLDANPIPTGLDSVDHVVVNVLDITEHKQAELALKYQAMHDPLTGLPNRAWFHRRLEDAIKAGGKRASASLLMLDIDRFREVNATFGHRNGDVLIQQFAERLTTAVGPYAMLGRLGGDEFGVLLDNASIADSTAMARSILSALQAPFEIVGQTFDVDASIGIALSPEHGHDAGTLLRHADVAMYLAKQNHDGFAVFSAKMDTYSPDRLALLGELRRSIEKGHLFLAYQPLIRIADRKVMGMEALVRWQHPTHGLIYPDKFIGLAEGTGAIKPLTIWVLNEALRQCSLWRSAGYDLEVAVNLSPRNVHDVGLPEVITDLLLKYQVPPNRLTLEITEGALMSDQSGALVVLTKLSYTGIRLAIDDFGTGYSSLAYLQRLPTNTIKIDKSFVLRVAENPNDAAIVKSIIDLGHNLGHTILAEGVEQAPALERLAQLNCDAAQGYYMSRPLPVPQIDDWIRVNM